MGVLGTGVDENRRHQAEGGIKEESTGETTGKMRNLGVR